MEVEGYYTANGSRWKTNLYMLQMQAPKPIPSHCESVENVRKHIFDIYGSVYHGSIDRKAVAALLHEEPDGTFLVRDNSSSLNKLTLVIKFDGCIKNYHLHYNEATQQHYVGDTMWDSLTDLVEDGLIHLYVESKGEAIIKELANSNFASYQQPQYDLSGSVMGETPLTQNLLPSFPNRIMKSPNQTDSTTRTTSQVSHDKSNNNERLKYRTQTNSLPTNTTLSRSKELHMSPKVVVSDARTRHEEVQGFGSNVNSMLERCSYVEDYPTVHNFSKTTFTGVQWCDHCLHFMWGLRAQGMRCLDCGFRAHKACSNNLSQMKCHKKVFGVELSTLLQAESGVVPNVIVLLIMELERRQCYLKPGIYRESAFVDHIDEVRMMLNRGCENVDLSKVDDITILSSLLKRFFISLPVPLIPFECYGAFVEVSKKDADHEGVVSDLRSTLKLLPVAYFQTLKYLMAHLHLISNHCEVNLMSANNLAAVFGPTLLRSPPDDNPGSILLLAKYEILVVKMLIQLYPSAYVQS